MKMNIEHLFLQITLQEEMTSGQIKWPRRPLHILSKTLNAQKDCFYNIQWMLVYVSCSPLNSSPLKVSSILDSRKFKFRNPVYISTYPLPQCCRTFWSPKWKRLLKKRNWRTCGFDNMKKKDYCWTPFPSDNPKERKHKCSNHVTVQAHPLSNKVNIPETLLLNKL